MLFPVLVGQDPFTGQYVPNGAIAERWDVSPDGLTYTFHLRSDVTWSDGDPVDAADFKFTYDALNSERVDSPYKRTVQNIAGIEVLDALTVRVSFKQLRCNGLADLRLGWLPSHLYEADYSDIMDSPLNTAPQVSAGPFLFQNWTPGESLVLRRNERYWQGAPLMERMVFRFEADPAARLAQLLGGAIDIARLEPSQITAIQGNTDLTLFSAGDDGYDFIALNLANPDNPQPGRDSNGAIVPQDPHPILGDRSVRQAIAQALDYKAMVDAVYLGRAYQIASNVLPVVPWAHDPSLPTYRYDPNSSRQILQDAGWVDSNSDGVREKDGQPLVLTLRTGAGNKLREDLGDLVQDQLNSVGFDILFETVDDGALLKSLLGQTYDMIIIGWTGLGADPADDAFWASWSDNPGSGFNFVSYQNPEIDQLLEQANATPGCAPEDRAPLYRQIQRIVHDDLPYVFIAAPAIDTAYNNRWFGIKPGAWDFYWNVQEWYTQPEQP